MKWETPGRAMFPAFFMFLMAGLPQMQAQFTASVSPDTAVVSGRSIFTVNLTATDTIPARSEVKIMTPSGLRNFVWPILTNIYFSTSGSSSVRVTAFASPQVEEPPIWEDDNLPVILSLMIINAPLLPGEVLSVTFGEATPDNERKIKILPKACTVQFRTALIPYGSDTWIETASVFVDVKPSVPSRFDVYAPSVVRTGDTAYIQMAVSDFEYNLSPQFRGRVRWQTDDPGAVVPSETVFTAADSGHVRIPVVFSGEGIFRVSAEVMEPGPSGTIVAGQRRYSNPVWVQDAPRFLIYWGDLHVHSGRSRDGQGFGSIDYARRTSCLDFVAAAEHLNNITSDTFGISPEEWRAMKDEVLLYHQPGRFIPITAYESSYYANEGGHHNTYFEHKDDDIDDIPLLPRKTYHSVFELWNRLNLLPSGIRALSWPHFTGVAFFADFSEPEWNLDDLSINQGPIPRLVGEEYISPYRALYEIYSDHGQSEYFNDDHPLNNGTCFWYVQDALALGERFGLIGSTDDHTARAGFAGAGIAAALSPELERPALFETFRKRRTYGTTSERMLIDFTVNDTLMGGEVNIEADMVPQIRFMVHGTSPIARVDILKWDFLEGTYGGDYHPDFETIGSFPGQSGRPHLEGYMQDQDFYGHSVYYLRVVQDTMVAGKPVWGWSSPVWVQNMNLDSTVLSVTEGDLRMSMSVYPNPVMENGWLSVRMDANRTASVEWRMVNASGRLMIRRTSMLWPGGHKEVFPLGELPPGTYWIEARTPGTRSVLRSMFVVQ